MAVTDSKHFRFQIPVRQDPTPNVAIGQRADQPGFAVDHEDDLFLRLLQLLHRLPDGMYLRHEKWLHIFIHEYRLERC